MGRPTSKRTLKIIDAVKSIVRPDRPTTIRFVLYKLISLGILESSKDYNQLQKLITQGRISGEIDDDGFVDLKRSTILSNTWDDLLDYGQTVIDLYRINPWKDQDVRVEVWVEKDTVALVLQNATLRWNVPLRASTGFFSRPLIIEAAKQIVECRKETYIYYVGDFDPSGMDVERAAHEGNDKTGTQKREGLNNLLDKYSDSRTGIPLVNWERLAVRPGEFDKLPDYAKVPIKKRDPRSPEFVKEYGEFGAEVEALSEEELCGRIESAIESHIDQVRWKKSEQREKADKKELSKLF